MITIYLGRIRFQIKSSWILWEFKCTAVRRIFLYWSNLASICKPLRSLSPLAAVVLRIFHSGITDLHHSTKEPSSMANDRKTILNCWRTDCCWSNWSVACWSYRHTAPAKSDTFFRARIFKAARIPNCTAFAWASQSAQHKLLFDKHGQTYTEYTDKHPNL